MRFKTLPIFTLATYRMGSNFSMRVTPNINLFTVGLMENTFYFDVQGNSEVYVKIIEGKHSLGKVKNIITFCHIQDNNCE